MPPAALRQGEGRSWSGGLTIESRAIPRLERGRYTARLADTGHDLERALALRARCFRASSGSAAGGGAGAARSDRDRFDAACAHMLVEDRVTGALVCTYRLQRFAGSAGIGQSYTGAHYGLSGLMQAEGPVLEMGRFCIAGAGGASGQGAGGGPDATPHRGTPDADILRIAWGAMTRYVDAMGVRLLFGCASFRGTDPAPYRDAFALLRERHLAPVHWRPTVKAPDVARFAECAAPAGSWDRRRAAATLPPLLRTYLAMGGRVSDHAVIDHDLGTLHVFVGLEIAAIPPARARALRLVAG